MDTFDIRKFLTENRDKDRIYFQSFSSAVNHARKSIESRGYEIDEDDWQTQIALGGKYSRPRPDIGDTHNFVVGLIKNGKPQRKALAIQVYGMDSGMFELNYYVN
jgi:hypothetical protein